MSLKNIGIYGLSAFLLVSSACSSNTTHNKTAKNDSPVSPAVIYKAFEDRKLDSMTFVIGDWACKA